MEQSTSAANLKCPKCAHDMEEVSVGDIVIDRCVNCKGLWFDADEAHRLKQMPDSHKVDIGDPREGWRWDSRAEIHCPRCGKKMEESGDPSQKHIWYEMCREHGIFMDAGEFTDFKFESLLDKFRSFIKGNRATTAP
jgi:Zn-finger nucleic acid-binding protein